MEEESSIASRVRNRRSKTVKASAAVSESTGQSSTSDVASGRTRPSTALPNGGQLATKKRKRNSTVSAPTSDRVLRASTTRASTSAAASTEEVTRIPRPRAMRTTARMSTTGRRRTTSLPPPNLSTLSSPAVESNPTAVTEEPNIFSQPIRISTGVTQDENSIPSDIIVIRHPFLPDIVLPNRRRRPLLPDGTLGEPTLDSAANRLLTHDERMDFISERVGELRRVFSEMRGLTDIVEGSLTNSGAPLFGPREREQWAQVVNQVDRMEAQLNVVEREFEQRVVAGGTRNPGLMRCEIDRLPRRLFAAGCANRGEVWNSSQLRCLICFADYELGESLRTLISCSHEYHVACIDEWLKTNASCPICRAVVIVE